MWGCFLLGSAPSSFVAKAFHAFAPLGIFQPLTTSSPEPDRRASTSVHGPLFFTDQRHTLEPLHWYVGAWTRTPHFLQLKK